MTRHKNLTPLSHDHHHALVQATGLIKASDSKDPATRLAQADEFLRFYRDETIQHFREEEELIFPLLLDYLEEVPPRVRELLVEHLAIHALVRRLRREIDEGAVTGEVLRTLGDLLRSHIRKEEKEIFPLLEQTVEEEVLRSVVLPPRRRLLRANRPSSQDTNRTHDADKQR